MPTRPDLDRFFGIPGLNAMRDRAEVERARERLRRLGVAFAALGEAARVAVADMRRARARTEDFHAQIESHTKG